MMIYLFTYRKEYLTHSIESHYFYKYGTYYSTTSYNFDMTYEVVYTMYATVPLEIPKFDYEIKRIISVDGKNDTRDVMLICDYYKDKLIFGKL